MPRLAIVGGHSLMGSGFGAVDEALHVGSGHVVLQRHGAPDHTPAHRVDHVANMRSLVAQGCDRVLALNSVGGLHHEVGTGTFLAPDDFIALHTSISIHDDARGYSIPSFDREWRRTVIDSWRDRATEIAPLRDGGVYWQTFGPRFETPAEVRFIGQFADVVGMTMASECIVARELGLRYASVCIVDNLANGLREQPLSLEEFEAGKRANQEALLATLAVVVPELRVTAALAVSGATRIDGTTVGLRAVDGTITELGPGVRAQPGDEVLDAHGDVLLPGLVNGHTHAAMTLFRGFGSDLPLMEWLEQKIWPAEARLTDEDVYWGTRLACLEMLSTGTVRFWDMYWRPAAVACAVRDAGIHATIGPPLLDGMDPARSKAACDEAARHLDELADYSQWVQPALAPHGIYTASEPTLAWVAEQSASRDIPVHLHFLETEDEVTGCVARTGERPGAYLDRLGMLSPRLVLAHGVWMEEPDLELVAERGATVVTNPVSNLKLAVGRVFPYPKLRAHGIPVGLGTDGASSNNSLDLFADLKVLALVQKHAANDPAALPATEAWEVANGGFAPLLDGTPDLEVGAPADFLLADAASPALAPGHVLDNLVYAASGAVVSSTVVGGRVLIRDRVVGERGSDQEVRAHVVECARRLGVL